ncbi:hypothetical protein [Fastidiosibacter lacustris]|uniref:hypothetical protein n=1 Tax=Fastidiosibacter lacustris TaxID=2056695 RepID=UPI000E352738|nr:hypothetical protein [Fastidiosibacter lacustris]
MSVNIEKIKEKLKSLRKENLDNGSRTVVMEKCLLTEEVGFIQTLVEKGINKDDAFVAWFALSPMATSSKTFDQFSAFVDMLENKPNEFSSMMQDVRDSYLVASGAPHLKVFLSENRYKNEQFEEAFNKVCKKIDASKVKNEGNFIFMQNQKPLEKSMTFK